MDGHCVTLEHMVPKFKLHDYVRISNKTDLGVGIIRQIDVDRDFETNTCCITYCVEFESASYSTIRLLGEQRRYERFPHVERVLEHRLISEQEFDAMSKMNLEEPIQSMKVGGYVSPISANVDYRQQDVITASIDEKWHRNMIAQTDKESAVSNELNIGDVVIVNAPHSKYHNCTGAVIQVFSNESYEVKIKVFSETRQFHISNLRRFYSEAVFNVGDMVVTAGSNVIARVISYNGNDMYGLKPLAVAPETFKSTWHACDLRPFHTTEPQKKEEKETMATPTNTPTILDTIKSDAIDGLYRSAADQLTELGTSILIEVLKAEGTDDSVLHHIADALKKPLGQAIARATAGYLIQAAPGLVPVPANIAPKLARLSKEFRTGAYAVGYNTVAEKVLPRLVPALTTLLAGLPEETV